jgi:hypothetical protein
VGIYWRYVVVSAGNIRAVFHYWDVLGIGSMQMIYFITFLCGFVACGSFFWAEQALVLSEDIVTCEIPRGIGLVAALIAGVLLLALSLIYLGDYLLG